VKEQQERQELLDRELAPLDRMADRDTSEAARVLPSVASGEKPVQAEITIGVVIPVFNEGSCIEGLLQDVLMAKQHDWFQIQDIYVISDASTDQTHDIVQRVGRRDHRIKLIRKRYRKGKQDSINLAFSVTKADVVVFLDADLRLASEYTIAKLVEPFRDGKASLVQGGLVRACPGFTLNPAKSAAYFDWVVVDKVRRRKAMSWWSIDGRVMALSKDFCQHLALPRSLADDQYIFYSCIQQGRKFIWADDAIIYYGPPESIAHFSHQWSRYFFYTTKSLQYFGKDLIAGDMSFPGLWRTIISCLIRHPLCGLTWVLCYGISRVEFTLGVGFENYERGLFWTKSKPIRTPAKGATDTKVLASHRLNRRKKAQPVIRVTSATQGEVPPSRQEAQLTSTRTSRHSTSGSHHRQ